MKENSGNGKATNNDRDPTLDEHKMAGGHHEPLLFADRTTVVESGQVERALDLERGQRLVVGEILDDQDNVAQMRAELFGQPGQRIARDRLDRVEPRGDIMGCIGGHHRLGP